MIVFIMLQTHGTHHEGNRLLQEHKNGKL